jgi:hypothetical protein
MYVGMSGCDALLFDQEILMGTPARAGVGEAILTETPLATVLAV